MHRHSDPAASPSATQLPSTPALCGQGLHHAQAEPESRPYMIAAESSRAASNQRTSRTWTMYTYWLVSLLLTSGGLLPAAWNAHDKGQNRLRTGVGRAKTVMRRWGYLDDAQSVDCDCGEPQTMAHLLSCRLLDDASTADDLATVIERAKACARKWEKIV